MTATMTTMIRTLALAMIGSMSIGCGQLDGGTGNDSPGAEEPDGGRPARPDAAADPACVEAPGVVVLADPLAAGTYAWRPAVTVGADQRPLVAWATSDQPSARVLVSAWDGTTWAPLGAMVNPGSASQFGPEIETRGDRVIVAWVEDLTGGGVLAPFAAEWNGASWTPLGGAVGGGPGVVIDVALAIDAAGAPIVAWSNFEFTGNHGNMSLRAARWNGASWVPLGAPLDITPDDETLGISPSLTATASGAVYLVWQEPAGGPSSVHIRALSGGQWTSHGGGSLDALGGATPVTGSRAVVDGDGRLVVAWSEGTGVFVARWSGSAWDRLASDLGAVGGDTAALVQGLALDRQQRPIVSWAEPATAGGALSTYVYHQTGEGFVPLAGGLFDAAPGMTGSSGGSLATDDCDRVFLAWSESTGDGRAGVQVRLVVGTPPVE